MELPTANVIVDFLIEDDFVSFVIKNHSDGEADKIIIHCESDIRLVDRKRTLNQLFILKNLRYLAPRKEIAIPISPRRLFFEDHPNPIFSIRIKYMDLAHNKVYSKQIVHDLRIYKDLPSIS